MEVVIQGVQPRFGERFGNTNCPKCGDSFFYKQEIVHWADGEELSEFTYKCLNGHPFTPPVRVEEKVEVKKIVPKL